MSPALSGRCWRPGAWPSRRSQASPQLCRSCRPAVLFTVAAWHLEWVSLPRGGNTLLAREEKPKGRGWGWRYRSSNHRSAFPSARRAGFPLWKGLCGQLAPQLPPRDRKSRTGRYWCKRKLWKNSLPREGGRGWTFPRALLTWLLRELAAWLPTKQLPWEPGALAACHRAAAARGRPSPGSLTAAEELLFPERKTEIPGEKNKKHLDFAEGTLSGRESRWPGVFASCVPFCLAGRAPRLEKWRVAWTNVLGKRLKIMWKK